MREIDLSVDKLLAALLRLDPIRGVHVLDGGGARNSRHLIAGFDPFESVEAYGAELIVRRRGSEIVTRERGSILSLLDERLAHHRAPRRSSPFFNPPGACVATFAYDLARQFLRLRSTKPQTDHSTPEEPDATLAFFDTLVVHDYTRRATYVTGPDGARVEETCEVLSAVAVRAGEGTKALEGTSTLEGTNAARDSEGSDAVVTSNFTRDEYLAAVSRIKEHISAGDIYQANLTQQLSCRLATGDSPEAVFLRLRRDHPAPFAAFLRRDCGDTVVSASPERFLRVEVDEWGGRTIEAWPIKGTRRRGINKDEDARLRAELLASEKDRAENTMIVDLLRNDLGRVCRYGSVEVAEWCAVEEHPTLFHLVSKVRGSLRPEVAAGELMRATFPCGSITGAPKLRAMEILDSVETAPRGFSMGALGYFAFDGALDLNVAIRTLTVRGGVARFNVGGGVVADSHPEAEYDESLLKARALLRALGAEE
ncbi:MAG: aminodeoxychorismate synthase component I [Pyrinomonadaceae bacterium]